MKLTERPQRIDGEDLMGYFRREDVWEVANGAKCYRCEGLASFVCPPGHRKLCHECKAIEENKDSVDSSKYIRCPKCRNSWSPYDREHYDLYGDGEHQVMCQDCDHEFEVRTSVSYSFESPALLPEIPQCDCGKDCPDGLNGDGLCPDCAADFLADANEDC